MRRVFGVSGPGAAAFCLGLIGGYPAGARAVAQLVEQSVCSQKEARRLSLFCNNCGPAFFLGAVGIGVFGQENVGFLLLTANLASAVSIGIFANILLGSTERSPPQSSSAIKRTSLINVFPDCIRSSFSATLNVCAYVILFSVISALADHTGLLPALGEFLGDLLPYTDSALLSRSLCIGLLEISTGHRSTPRKHFPLRFLASSCLSAGVGRVLCSLSVAAFLAASRRADVALSNSKTVTRCPLRSFYGTWDAYPSAFSAHHDVCRIYLFVYSTQLGNHRIVGTCRYLFFLLPSKKQ